MKKDCEECVKNDRNHHAEDCLYCMRFNAIIEAAEKYASEAEDHKIETNDPFCLNLTTVKPPHPGGD